MSIWFCFGHSVLIFCINRLRKSSKNLKEVELVVERNLG